MPVPRDQSRLVLVSNRGPVTFQDEPIDRITHHAPAARRERPADGHSNPIAATPRPGVPARSWRAEAPGAKAAPFNNVLSNMRQKTACFQFQGVLQSPHRWIKR